MQEYLAFVSRHPVLFALLAAVVVLIIWTEIRRFTSGFRQVSPAEAVRLINQDETLLLDVRDANEVRTGVIGGAKHIPLADLTKRVDELEKFRDKTILAYCRSGSRSAQACSQLLKRDFKNVVNLKGGIMAWQEANLPLSKK
ncbi:MAG: rhodanese-like domain-containing protein [Gammaproteobacteria bacterium]|jgi:rhodanese-related sulfurtransferase